MNKKVNILGCSLDIQTLEEVLDKISKCLEGDKQIHIVTPNPEIILFAHRHPDFLSILNRAAINVADGTGLQWAANYNQIFLTQLPVLKQIQAFIQLILSLIWFFFSKKYTSRIIPENITGTDLVPEICRICAEQEKKIFLLGGISDVAKITSQKLAAQYPNLLIAGYSNLDPDFKHECQIIEQINKTKPDCLLVAYGAPKQEYWIDRNLKKIPSVKIVAGIGGAFDFISGSVSFYGGPPATRAPLWLRRNKLEWFYRLVTQPNRISRIINAVVVFPLTVMIAKINTK